MRLAGGIRDDLEIAYSRLGPIYRGVGACRGCRADGPVDGRPMSERRSRQVRLSILL